MSLDTVTIQVISVGVTVTLAFIGYIATYINNVRIESRKGGLKFISDQLQYLYGPLYSLSSASQVAWMSFRSKCRPRGAFFGTEPPPSDDELRQWRLWMTEVFMPINLKMEKAIIENGHLIDGHTMPSSFQSLIAHIEVYKAVVKKWESNDFSEHTSYLNFPEEIDKEVSIMFNTLKTKQSILLGGGRRPFVFGDLLRSLGSRLA